MLRDNKNTVNVNTGQIKPVLNTKKDDVSEVMLRQKTSGQLIDKAYSIATAHLDILDLHLETESITF